MIRDHHWPKLVALIEHRLVEIAESMISVNYQ